MTILCVRYAKSVVEFAGRCLRWSILICVIFVVKSLLLSRFGFIRGLESAGSDNQTAFRS